MRLDSVQQASYFSSRSIVSLHFGPNFRIAHIPQELAHATSATIVNSHPLPIASIIGWATTPIHFISFVENFEFGLRLPTSDARKDITYEVIQRNTIRTLPRHK